MKLKPQPKNKLPLVDYFIQSVISGKIPSSTLHQKVIDNIISLDDFDSQIESFDFNMIDFGTSDLKKSQEMTIALAQLITAERENLLKHFNLTEQNNYITVPQKRVVILTEEAFHNMGNNKLNIKENKNEYSLIFG